MKFKFYGPAVLLDDGQIGSLINTADIDSCEEAFEKLSTCSIVSEDGKSAFTPVFVELIEENDTEKGA